MSTVALTIDGMSCQHCVRAVREALEAVPGVTVSRVDIGSAEVFVEGDVADETISAAVSEAGYETSVASR